ncbi:hypothetical protein ADIMK_2407 [Marinobacterium lacunae]|uniref:Uncharacterized protein n=1 Tax=Marinobacterium lacunae TaxID=1232683 RepID=A0A081FXW5_9GAMM|nr:hypothetical protein ADIMK_2407 [Marinobacterium lacunae]
MVSLTCRYPSGYFKKANIVLQIDLPLPEAASTFCESGSPGAVSNQIGFRGRNTEMPVFLEQKYADPSQIN